jgi:hypothetical protein
MATEELERRSKRKRQEERRRAAHRRVLMRRARRGGIVALLLAIPSLWAFEHSGPQERVEAEVIETRRWRHLPQGREPHPHVAATLQVEGLSETTLERADGYERGQRVQVWIRRGRISGWPHFLDVVKPGELARETEARDGNQER